MDGNAQGAHDEEGEDKETITVAIYEHGHLIVDDVMAANPVTELFEENDDDGDVESEAADERHLFTLPLIDFAHTRLVPGRGPDTGVLLGVDTLIGLIHERRSVVQALVDEGASVKNPC